MAIKPKYRCDECHGVYDTEFAAEECCRPTVSEVYVCPICKEAHNDEEDALNCCDAEAVAELTQEDGRQFPQGITSPAEYIKAFCEANKLTV